MPLRSRALAMIDALVFSALLLPVLLISTGIIVQSSASIRQANVGRATAHRFDGMVDQLRRDVWSSTAISMPDDSSVHIDLDDRKIVWTQKADGTILRIDLSPSEVPQRTWENLPAISFSLRGNLLKLRAEDKNEPAEILLQRHMAGRMN